MTRVPRRLDIFGEMIDRDRAGQAGDPADRGAPGDLISSLVDLTPLVLAVDSRRSDSSRDPFRRAALSVGSAAMRASDEFEARQTQSPIDRLGRLVRTTPDGHRLWAAAGRPFARWQAAALQELRRADCAVLCTELVLELDSRASYAA